MLWRNAINTGRLQAVTTRSGEMKPVAGCLHRPTDKRYILRRVRSNTGDLQARLLQVAPARRAPTEKASTRQRTKLERTYQIGIGCATAAPEERWRTGYRRFGSGGGSVFATLQTLQDLEAIGAMRSAGFYLQKAAECRRRARDANDYYTRQLMLAFADEFERRAAKVAASANWQQSGWSRG
jgi:hypothetical protein